MTEQGKWSSNFDGVDVERFLRHLASKIESGFSDADARRVAKKIRTCFPGAKAKFNFDIVVGGEQSQLKIRAYMEDLDSPGLFFDAPAMLCEMMQLERQRTEQELSSPTSPGGINSEHPSQSLPPIRIRAVMWLLRVLSFFRRSER